MVMYAEENGYYCWLCVLGVQDTKSLFYGAAFWLGSLVGVPCGHCWYVRQCGCYVVPGGRMGREEEKWQNLKNVPSQNPGGLTFWFSLSLCGSGQ